MSQVAAPTTKSSVQSLVYIPKPNEVYKEFPGVSEEMRKKMSIEEMDALVRKHIPIKVRALVRDVLKTEKYAVIAPEEDERTGYSQVSEFMDRVETSSYKLGIDPKTGKEISGDGAVAVKISPDRVTLYVRGGGIPVLPYFSGSWGSSHSSKFSEGEAVKAFDLSEIEEAFYGPWYTGKISDSSSHKDDIIRDIAYQLEDATTAELLGKALERFDRQLPESMKNVAYGCLSQIQEKKGVTGSWRSGEYAFRGEHNLSASPKERREAVEEMLVLIDLGMAEQRAVQAYSQAYGPYGPYKFGPGKDDVFDLSAMNRLGYELNLGPLRELERIRRLIELKGK